MWVLESYLLARSWQIQSTKGREDGLLELLPSAGLLPAGEENERKREREELKGILECNRETLNFIVYVIYIYIYIIIFWYKIIIPHFTFLFFIIYIHVIYIYNPLYIDWLLSF
jgi:hypothetical protein